MVYGYCEKDNCDDVEWLFGFDNIFKEEVIKFVCSLNFIGKIFLACFVCMAFDQFREQQKIVIFIFIIDGIEFCDGDLCQIIVEAQLVGIDFKLYIVGFGIKEEIVVLWCVVDVGGGQYFDVFDVDKFVVAFQEVIWIIVDNFFENFFIFVIKNG